MSCHNFSSSSPGRIWLKWNVDTINFMPMYTSSQLIHGMLSSSPANMFALTVVYAANSLAVRVEMWEQLFRLAEGINFPWIIMGDFNCYKDAKEKYSGSIPNHSRMNELNTWMFESRSFDLASTGLKFS
ncbi:hypothetical protein MA16_Dca002880 [Dendrobium catenatum]|uniref:Endonuclease/exonuclease/phosphatase domain-containing protein n=1 Tax=Dendrobium catenatum TaxID=906689 RepID=A0A2I0X8V5_9ASPA|nr:hypothetical protein MA16_Dca002880 [Dendrobium catenatum]